jgi:predicted Zn-dependent peptidase
VIGFRSSTLLCLGALLLPAQDVRDYGRKVTEFSLANGLHFIVLERHQIPVVSFHTYVMAGSAQDPAGGRGLASLLARLAFDGTESVGTKNWPLEKKALEDVEAAYGQYEDEFLKGPKANAGKLAGLQSSVGTALGVAFQQQNVDEYTRALQENGAVDMDSHATPDSIETSYSLPSNRLELWFYLESQRLAHPVYRDFFRERKKLADDAFAMLDAKSFDRLRQSLLSTAFEGLPYRNPVLGWPSEVLSLSQANVRAFFDTYCGPGNTVIAIVGDVDPANAHALAERYFSSIPAKPRPPAMRTEEVPQSGPKTVAIWTDAQPLLMMGYKRPPETQRDDAALDVLSMILGDRQTGLLNQELVEQKQIALSAQVNSGTPASKYPNLFVLSVAPGRGHSMDEIRKAVDGVVTRLQSKPLDADSVNRAKNVVRGRYTHLLSSNARLAALLPSYYATFGDWRPLFGLAPQYDQVTAADVQRVAFTYLVQAGQTIAYMMAQPTPGNSPNLEGGQ